MERYIKEVVSQLFYFDFDASQKNVLGYGIGSFFGGLFKHVLPLLKSTGVYLGRELVQGASSLLDTVEGKNMGEPSTARKGLKAILGSINKSDTVSKISGEGYKSASGVKRRAQSRKGKSAVSKAKKRKSKSRKRKSQTKAATRQKLKRKISNNTKKKRAAAKKTRLTNIKTLAAAYSRKPTQPDYFNA